MLRFSISRSIRAFKLPLLGSRCISSEFGHDVDHKQFEQLPMSRKSRSTSSETSLEIVTIPKHEFVQRAIVLFETIWASLEKLAPINREGGLPFRLQRDTGFIRVEVDDARVFYWQRLEEDCRIMYSSPNSLAFYEYSKDLDRWMSIGVGKYDSHDAMLLIEQNYSKSNTTVDKNTINEVDDLSYTALSSSEIFYDTTSSLIATCYDDIPLFYSDSDAASDPAKARFCDRVLNGEIPLYLDRNGPAMSIPRYPFIDSSLIVSTNSKDNPKSCNISMISNYCRFTLRNISIMHRNFLSVGPLPGKSRECHRLDLRLRFMFYQLMACVQCLHKQGIMLESISSDSVSINPSLWLSISPALSMNLCCKTRDLTKSLECHVLCRTLAALTDTEKCNNKTQRQIARLDGDSKKSSLFKTLKVLWICLVRLENEVKRIKMDTEIEETKSSGSTYLIEVPFPPDIDRLSSWPATWYSSIAERWILGEMSNWEYLLRINHAAGRCLKDSWFHPILPWVSDFSEKEEATCGKNKGQHWRNLALSKFRSNKGDHQLDLTFEYSQPPHHIPESLSELTFCIYMARKLPISMLREVVRSDFIPEHYPSSIQRMHKWTPDECIPEFFSDASVFCSTHKEHGMLDLEFPSWCSSAEEFIAYHRRLLESSQVSANLHMWIDLLFGVCLSPDYPQSGKGSCALFCKNVPLGQQTSTSKLTDFPKHSGFVQIFHCPHPKRIIGTDGNDLALFRRSNSDDGQKSVEGNQTTAKDDSQAKLPSYVVPSPFGSAVLSLNDSLRASTITLAMTPLVSTAPIAEAKLDMFDYILSSSNSSGNQFMSQNISPSSSSSLSPSNYSVPVANIGINSSSLITMAVGIGDNQVPTGVALSVVSQSVSQRNFMSLNSSVSIAPDSNSYRSIIKSVEDLKRRESLLAFGRNYDAVLDSPTFECAPIDESNQGLQLWHSFLRRLFKMLQNEIDAARIEVLACLSHCSSDQMNVAGLYSRLTCLSSSVKLISSIFRARIKHLQSEDMIRVGIMLGELYIGHSPISATAIKSLVHFQDVQWIAQFNTIVKGHADGIELNECQIKFGSSVAMAISSWNSWISNQVSFSFRSKSVINWYNSNEAPWFIPFGKRSDELSSDSSSHGFTSALDRLKSHRLCKIGPLHSVPAAIRVMTCRLLEADPCVRLSDIGLLDSSFDQSFCPMTTPSLMIAESLSPSMSALMQSSISQYFSLNRNCTSHDVEYVFGEISTSLLPCTRKFCLELAKDFECKEPRPGEYVWDVSCSSTQTSSQTESLEVKENMSRCISNPNEDDVDDLSMDHHTSAFMDEEEEDVLMDGQELGFQLSNFFPSYFKTIYLFDFEFFDSIRAVYLETKGELRVNISVCVEVIANLHLVVGTESARCLAHCYDDAVASMSQYVQQSPEAIQIISRSKIKTKELELCHKWLSSGHAIASYGFGLVLPTILSLIANCSCISMEDKPFTIHRVSSKHCGKSYAELSDSNQVQAVLARNRNRLTMTDLNFLSFSERVGIIGDTVDPRKNQLHVFRIMRDVIEVSTVKQAFLNQARVESPPDSWQLSYDPRCMAKQESMDEASLKRKCSDDVLKGLIDKYVELVSHVGDFIKRDLCLRLLIPCVHGFIVGLKRPKAVRMLMLSNLWANLINCGTPREFVRRFVPFMIDLLLTGLVERTAGESIRFKRLQPAASMAVASLASPACLGPALTARYLLPRLAVAINSPASLYHPSRMDISAARFAVFNPSETLRNSRSSIYDLERSRSNSDPSCPNSCALLSDSSNDRAISMILDRRETVVVRMSSQRLIVSRQVCDKRAIIAVSEQFFVPFKCPIYSCGGDIAGENYSLSEALTLSEDSSLQAKSIGEGFLAYYLQQTSSQGPLICIESNIDNARQRDCVVDCFELPSDQETEDMQESGDEDHGESFEATNFCLVRALVGIGQQLCEVVISPLILEGLIADKLLKSVKAVSSVVLTCSDVCNEVSGLLLKIHCLLGNSRQSQSLSARSRSDEKRQLISADVVDGATASLLVDCVNKALTRLDINPTVLSSNFGYSNRGISVDLSNVQYSPTAPTAGVFLSVPFCPPDSTALYSSTTPLFLPFDNLYENETLIRDLLMILTPKTVTRILFQTESCGFVQSIRLVPAMLEATRWFGQVIDSIDEFRYAHFNLRVDESSMISETKLSIKATGDAWKNALARLGVIRKILFRELLRLHSLASVIVRTFYTACHFVGGSECARILQAEISMFYGAMAHVLCPKFCAIPSSVAFVVLDSGPVIASKNWLGSRSQSSNSDKASLVTQRYVLYSPLPIRGEEKNISPKFQGASVALHDDAFFVTLRVLRELHNNISEWAKIVTPTQNANLPNSVVTKLDGDNVVNLEFPIEFVSLVKLTDEEVCALERKSLFCRMLSPSRFYADQREKLKSGRLTDVGLLNGDDCQSAVEAMTLASDNNANRRFTALKKAHIRDDSLTIVTESEHRLESMISSDKSNGEAGLVGRSIETKAGMSSSTLNTTTEAKSSKSIKQMFGKGLNWISKKHGKFHEKSIVQPSDVVAAGLKSEQLYVATSNDGDTISVVSAESNMGSAVRHHELQDLKSRIRDSDSDSSIDRLSNHSNDVHENISMSLPSPKVMDKGSPIEPSSPSAQLGKHQTIFGEDLLSHIHVEEDYFSSRPSFVGHKDGQKFTGTKLRHPRVASSLANKEKLRLSSKSSKKPTHWKFLSPISSAASFSASSPLPPLDSLDFPDDAELKKDSYVSDDIDQRLTSSRPFSMKPSSKKADNRSSLNTKVPVVRAVKLDKRVIEERQSSSALSVDRIKKLLAATDVSCLFYFSPADGSASSIPTEDVDIANEDDDSTANDRTWLMSGASRIGALRAKIESLDTLSFGFTVRCQFEACAKRKPIRCITVNDTESFLAACTSSHGIRLWDLRHHPIHHAESFPKSGEGLYDSVHTLLFGDNNKKLLSCSSQDGIEIWDLKRPSRIPLCLLHGPAMSIPNASLAACLVDRVAGLASLRKPGPYSWMTQNDSNYLALHANQPALSNSSASTTVSISASTIGSNAQSPQAQMSNGFSAMEIVGLGEGIDFGYEDIGSFDQILAAYADGIQLFDLRESTCRCVAQWQFSDSFSAEPESLLDKGIFSSKPASTIGFPGSVRCLRSILATDLIAAGSSSGHIALVDKRIGGRVVQSWQAHDSSILKMHSTKSGQLVTLSSDMSSCIWNCASSQLSPCYSLDQASFFSPVEKLSSIKGLPDSQGLLSSNSSCLVQLHRQDDDENDFLSSLIRQGDSGKGEYGFEGINKPIQPYRDSVDDSTQFNEYLFVVSGHKLVSTMLSTTINSTESVSLTFPNELKLDKIYFHDKFGSKFSRQKLSAHSVQVLPLRKLMLLGCDDGSIRICT